MGQESLDKEPLDIAVLQVVMEEFSNKQEASSQQIAQLLKEVSGLNDQLKTIIQSREHPDNAEDYTSVILNSIEKKFREQQKVMMTKPVKTAKEFRILLFPEQDRKLFYKIVFGRWLLYLTIMLLLNNTYKFALHYGDSKRIMQSEQLKSGHVERSWEYLYKNSGRQVRRLMDDVYHKTDTMNNR
jgi:hypothetical protein